MGQLPKKNIYAIGSFRSTPQTTFFEKCFNELGLPHTFQSVDRGVKGSVETFCMQPNFGGAYINPPLHASQPYIPLLSDAARTIGAVDTIVVRGEGANATLIGDNATWKGIRATLTRDFAPSAYKDRAAIILSSNGEDAASIIFALKSLNIGKIYTIGFKAQGPLAAGVEPFTSMESVQKVDQPFAIISALAPEKSHLVQPLLRHFSDAKPISQVTSASSSFVDSSRPSSLETSRSSASSSGNGGKGKVFLDLSNGPRRGDPLAVAEQSGWTAYGIADTSAFTTVETLRLLVGQNVPYSFVRLASGRGLY
jgi:3-dehydroquinate dehydratase-1